jgi:acyl-CoA thioesterase I
MTGELSVAWQTGLQMGRAAAALKAVTLIVLVAPAAADEPCRIAVLGDSLVAGYGIDLEQAYPAQLERALAERGHACEVLNAGVPGDTSAGGLARLDWTLADRPTHVIVELGANDALRALPIEQMRGNLDAIIGGLIDAEVEVLLAGMLAPPNLGRDYTEAFEAVFVDLAETHEIAFYPFFLDGVAAEPDLLLQDGLHPNAAGVRVMVERSLPYVLDWLGDAGLSPRS